jgi:hypothetical protein
MMCAVCGHGLHAPGGVMCKPFFAMPDAGWLRSGAVHEWVAVFCKMKMTVLFVCKNQSNIKM